jgi:hypothetical protein
MKIAVAPQNQSNEPFDQNGGPTVVVAVSGYVASSILEQSSASSLGTIILPTAQLIDVDGRLHMQ